MVINVDKVYLFDFKQDFESLNGIYMVDQLLSYSEMIDLQISLFDFLYALVGKTTEEFNTDEELYRNSNIYKLTNTDTGQIIYIPDNILKLSPDPNVRRYMKLVMSLDLGVFDNIEKLKHVASIMQEHIAGTTGILKDPDLDSYGYTWMTESDYKKHEEDRDEDLKKVINFFTETVRLRKVNDSLITKVQAYEDIISNLS